MLDFTRILASVFLTAYFEISIFAVAVGLIIIFIDGPLSFLDRIKEEKWICCLYQSIFIAQGISHILLSITDFERPIFSAIRATYLLFGIFALVVGIHLRHIVGQIKKKIS